MLRLRFGFTVGAMRRRRFAMLAGSVAVAIMAGCLGSLAGARSSGHPGASAAGRIFTIAGTGVPGTSGDRGPATRAKLEYVGMVASTPDGGFLLIAGDRVRRVSPSGLITTVAGTGERGFSGDGGPAKRAELSAPSGLAVLPGGGFLIADSENERVRRVSPKGIITTVAGTGEPGFSGDRGPATHAELDFPRGLAVLPAGGFLIADYGNERVRRVSPKGIITTVAGTGKFGFSGDGRRATRAKLSGPADVAVLPGGGFLIADEVNERVRRIDTNGIITTVAGTGESSGTWVEGGPAKRAPVSPKGVAALPGGGFLIADSGGVYRVNGNGRITTAAGGMEAQDYDELASADYATGDGGPASRSATGGVNDVATLPGGGFLLTDGPRVRLVTGPSTKLLGFTLGDPRRDRVASGAYVTQVSVSGPSRVSVQLLRGHAIKARRTLIVRQLGWVDIRLNGHFGTGILEIRAVASTGDANATQIRLAAFGGTLLDRWAIKLAGGDRATRVKSSRTRAAGAPTVRTDEPQTARSADDVEPPNYRTPLCQRFSLIRVDCEIESADGTPFACDHVTSLVLRQDGQIYQRDYRCPNTQHPSLFKQKPTAWSNDRWTPLDLSPLR